MKDWREEKNLIYIFDRDLEWHHLQISFEYDVTETNRLCFSAFVGEFVETIHWNQSSSLKHLRQRNIKEDGASLVFSIYLLLKMFQHACDNDSLKLKLN